MLKRKQETLHNTYFKIPTKDTPITIAYLVNAFKNYQKLKYMNNVCVYHLLSVCVSWHLVDDDVLHT